MSYLCLKAVSEFLFHSKTLSATEVVYTWPPVDYKAKPLLHRDVDRHC